MSSPDRLRASMLVIGDEILGGFVQDTNSGFVARRLQELGVPLDRVVTVPDWVDAIGEALLGELGRPRPRLVLTSGGIGSTPDDLTLAAVAAALDRALVVEPGIDSRITRWLEWTASKDITVTHPHEQAMRRMALVPAGTYLLPGAEGLVPGIAVDVDGGVGAPAGATVVVLPGIPAELQRIVRQGVEPALLEGRGIPDHVLELEHGYPESTLNPVFGRVVEEFPEVHLGSYPARVCLVRLTGPPAPVEAAGAAIRAYLAELDADPSAARLRRQWAARWE